MGHGQLVRCINMHIYTHTHTHACTLVACTLAKYFFTSTHTCMHTGRMYIKYVFFHEHTVCPLVHTHSHASTRERHKRGYIKRLFLLISYFFFSRRYVTLNGGTVYSPLTKLNSGDVIFGNMTQTASDTWCK